MNYALPAMAGFGLNLSYTPENSTDPDAESSWGANLSFATREHTIAAHAFEFGNTSAVPDHKVAAVSVAYNFGPGSVGAAFVASSDEAGIAGHDRDIWTVGASFKLGGGTLKAQYTSSDEYDDAPDSGATQIALGYDYPLGKNATAYLVYARMDNDDAAAFTPANYGHGKSAGVAANGETPSGLGIGLVYDFAKGW
jgi:predicted porin